MWKQIDTGIRIFTSPSACTSPAISSLPCRPQLLFSDVFSISNFDKFSTGHAEFCHRTRYFNTLKFTNSLNIAKRKHRGADPDPDQNRRTQNPQVVANSECRPSTAPYGFEQVLFSPFGSPKPALVAKKIQQNALNTLNFRNPCFNLKRSTFWDMSTELYRVVCSSRSVEKLQIYPKLLFSAASVLTSSADAWQTQRVLTQEPHARIHLVTKAYFVNA